MAEHRQGRCPAYLPDGVVIGVAASVVIPVVPSVVIGVVVSAVVRMVIGAVVSVLTRVVTSVVTSTAAVAVAARVAVPAAVARLRAMVCRAAGAGVHLPRGSLHGGPRARDRQGRCDGGPRAGRSDGVVLRRTDGVRQLLGRRVPGE